MDLHEQQRLTDEIQQRLTQLNAMGRDVVEGFAMTARLNREIAKDAISSKPNAYENMLSIVDEPPILVTLNNIHGAP